MVTGFLGPGSDRVETTNGHKILAIHTRCYGREQDILNPLHYLPLLFTFISQRYQRASLIVTSNLGSVLPLVGGTTFAEWTEVFGDARLTSALLDRLTHRCHILEFTGKSYRFRRACSVRQVHLNHLAC